MGVGVGGGGEGGGGRGGGGGGGELLHCPHPPRFSLQPKMPNARLIGPLGGEKEGEGGVG